MYRPTFEEQIAEAREQGRSFDALRLQQSKNIESLCERLRWLVDKTPRTWSDSDLFDNLVQDAKTIRQFGFALTDAEFKEKSAPAAQLRCDQCDRPIVGQTYQRRGQPVCADCWDKSDEAEAERAERRAFEASWKGSR